MMKIWKPTEHGTYPGQSLMEFVLVMPILVLILLGGFSFGMGAYEAHMASDAIQVPSAHKLDMGKIPAPVSSGTMLGYVTGNGTSGTLKSGDLLDNITQVPIDNYTSILVGTKDFAAVASFLPGFTIKTAQIINRGLLDSASTGGATTRPATTPWVPGGTPVMPPWASTATTTTGTTATGTTTGTATGTTGTTSTTTGP